METIKKTKTVTYEVYKTSDGKEFENKTDAQSHQDVLDGKRKICEKCKGKGKINYREVEYNYDYGRSKSTRTEYDECPDCNGKGYLELKWI